MEKTKTEIKCSNCGHTWKTVRKHEAFCRKCGVGNDVPEPGKMAVLVEEKYVIQYQELQWVDWYDTYRATADLSTAQEILESNIFVGSKERGVRCRIVKRTIYEEVVG